MVDEVMQTYRSDHVPYTNQRKPESVNENPRQQLIAIEMSDGALGVILLVGIVTGGTLGASLGT